MSELYLWSVPKVPVTPYEEGAKQVGRPTCRTATESLTMTAGWPRRLTPGSC